MSRTEIYRLGEHPGALGETQNAWRSAMQVWNYVAQKYCDMERFPLMGNDEASWRVWHAWKLPAMPEHEKIVLLSTLDKATVQGVNRDRLVEAFRKYAYEHGSANTSIGEQADIIQDAEDTSDDDVIAWNQTSVCTFWGYVDDPDNPDEWAFYDPSKSSEHWDIFDALSKLNAEQAA